MTDPNTQPTPYHALTELSTRSGWRNPALARRDDAHLAERTVFRDTATGYTAWRMTCDPAVDVDDYYDIPAWNANGSLLGFLSRRGCSSRRRWLMDANGDRLRPFPTADGREIGAGFWSGIHPERFYHAVKDTNGTHVVAENPSTGARETIVSVNRDLGQMMPPHPSEKWFLFGYKQGNEDVPEGIPPPDTPSVAYVVSLQGKVQEVHFERRWHRLRFTKAPDRRLFFNYDEPRTQWTILPDGTDRHEIPYTGGHPDWPMDGSELTFFNDGHVWGVPHDGSRRRSVIQLDSGGHGGPCLDGEWFVSDTPDRGRYPGSILCFRTDGSEECHVLFKHMASLYSHNAGGWHPDHHSTHPHPNSSPDGTKIVFNSDFLGQYSDLYVVINRLPDPPQDLKVNRQENALVLSWDAPRRSRETKGYHVYRRSAQGQSWARLTQMPVQQRQWRSTAYAPGEEYTVTAQEWSGLEGHPSQAVRATGEAAGTPPERLDTTAPPAPAGIQVQALNPNALGLRWDAVDVADLDHYNVYCAPREDVACAQDTLVGSPSSNEFVDQGLALEQEYAYRVTAVDRAGNESSPSPAACAQTPAFEPVQIVLAPWAADTQGMEPKDTPEGQVLVPVGSGAVATWSFHVPRDGRYAIWGRSMRERPEDETIGRVHKEQLTVCFQVHIDEAPPIPWTAWGFWGEWHWSPAGKADTGSPATVALKAGRHTLRIEPGNNRSRLAGLVVTDDPTWWPVTGMRKQT